MLKKIAGALNKSLAPISTDFGAFFILMIEKVIDLELIRLF